MILDNMFNQLVQHDDEGEAIQMACERLMELHGTEKRVIEAQVKVIEHDPGNGMSLFDIKLLLE
jgi:hypothetical protein